MEELSDKLFTIEMKILWKNNVSTRVLLECMIKSYFEKERAKKIINKFNEVV